MRSTEKTLKTILKRLSDEEKESLLAFGEFLLSRQSEKPPEPVLEPQYIPRPEKESVVGAIKRLSKTYAMLDEPKLLDQASSLMTQHVMQGRNVIEVIDELEVLFLSFYDALLQNRKS